MKTKLLLTLLLISSYTFAQTYVNVNATGTNNGTSWANAYISLQSAIVATNAGDEIWVAAGTYKPSTSSRTTYFIINDDNLKIYGGFAGTETSITDRVFGTNETILSGDLQDNDVNSADFASNYSNTTRNADNSYRIINVLAENLLLEGLTISGAHNNSGATTKGGAIIKLATVKKLTIRNCTVKDNVCRNYNAALYTEFSLNNVGSTRGFLIIENCHFTNNMSRGGSSIYCLVGTNTLMDVTISNSLFDYNTVGDLSSTLRGVAASSTWLRTIGNNSDATFTLSNNTYVNNTDKGTDLPGDNFRAPLSISENGGITSTITASVANSVFWNNHGVTNNARAISDMFEVPIPTLNVYNCLDALNFVEGSITASINTIITDPLFTDSANGDYTLQSGSPAIDSGDNSKIPAGIVADLLGNARIFNTTIDMGCYEFGASPVVSVENEEITKFSIFPNPVKNTLNIKIENSLNKVIIFNIQGQKVLETNTEKIDISNLQKGFYIIKIEDENGKVATQKIIKS